MNTRFKSALILIAETEIWWVSLAIGLSIVKTDWLPWAVLIAVLFWGIRWAAYGKLSQRTPVDLAVGLLVLMIPVTLWATALPEKTTPQVYRLLSGILLFYAIINWAKDRQRLGLLGAGLLLVGLALAGGSLISVQWATAKLPLIPPEVYERFTLLVSDTVNPNVLAGSVVLIIPLALALILFAWRELTWGLRGLAGMGVLVCTGILVLTQSRSALIALGAAGAVIVLLRWRWSWVVLPGAALAAGALYLAGYFPSQAALSAGVQTIFGTLGLDGRLELWSRAIYASQDFPFTGIGLGSFNEVVDLLYPLFLVGPGKASHAHNLFLQIAVDLGIPGLIAWLAILLLVLATAWQLYRFGQQAQKPLAAALGAGFLGSQVALIIHGLTDAVTWGMVRPAPLVWAVWGLATAAWLVMIVPQKNKLYGRAPVISGDA